MGGGCSSSPKGLLRVLAQGFGCIHAGDTRLGFRVQVYAAARSVGAGESRAVRSPWELQFPRSQERMGGGCRLTQLPEALARVNAGRHEQFDALASEVAEEGQGRHSPVPTPSLYVPATHVCRTSSSSVTSFSSERQ